MMVCRWMASVTFALAASAHAAGEITLYEHADFAGQQLTIRQAVADLGALKFNDRVSSIVVTTGRWQLCTDANFAGQCVVLTRGHHTNLERKLNDKFSSVRNLDDVPGAVAGTAPAAAAGVGPVQAPPQSNKSLPPVWPAGKVSAARAVLYQEEQLRGATHEVRQAQDLAGTPQAYSTASMTLEGSNWELCEGNAYTGLCKVYAPGSYRAMIWDGGVFRIVSLRPSTRAAQLQVGPQGVAVDAPPATATAPAPAAAVVAAAPAAAAPSPFPGATPITPTAPPQGIELFDALNFSGRKVAVQGDVANLRSQDFNDRAASLVIHTGQWMLCTDAEYKGQCFLVGPGRYAHMGDVGGKLSSLRRVQ